MNIVHLLSCNCIGGVMGSVLASSVVDRGFEPQSCEFKECCCSAKHAAFIKERQIGLEAG